MPRQNRFSKALEIHQKVLGPQHYHTATSLRNLAVLYHAMGDYAKAGPLFKEALEIRQSLLAVAHQLQSDSVFRFAHKQALRIPPSLYRPQRPDRRPDGVLDPKCNVLIEGGNPLFRRHETRARLVGGFTNELNDRLFSRSIVP